MRYQPSISPGQSLQRNSRLASVSLAAVIQKLGTYTQPLRDDRVRATQNHRSLSEAGRSHPGLWRTKGRDFRSRLSLVTHVSPSARTAVAPLALQWILSGATPRQIVLRLATLQMHCLTGSALATQTLPAWIFTKLLNAVTLDPASLRLLKALLWLQYGDNKRVTPPVSSAFDVLCHELCLPPDQAQALRRRLSLASVAHINDSTLQLLISKLVLQARRVWSAALPDLAQLYLQCLEKENTQSHGQHHDERYARLCRGFNHVLSMFALPNAEQPFRLMHQHREAQSILLRSMRNHVPPLVLTRQGFRALGTVQLGLPKSGRRKTMG